MNIIDLVKDQLDGHFARTAQGITGVGPEQTRKTVGGGIPAILAGLLGAVSTRNGANALASALRDQDPDILGNMSGMLTDDSQQSSLIGSGVETLTSLLGQSKTTSLVTALSGFGGISQGAGQSLIGLLTPIVLGVLGREQRSAGLGTEGLVKMLQGQKANIAGALPSGLSKSLGAAGLLESLDDAPRATRPAPSVAATRAPPRTDRRGRNWAVLAGIAVLGLVAWGLMRDSDPDPEPVRQAAQDIVPDTDTQLAVADPDDTNRMIVDNVDVGEAFTTLVNRLSSTMRDVTDAESAQAALPSLSALTDELDTLTPLIGRLSGSAELAFRDIARSDIADVRAEVERINAIPGVPDSVTRALMALNVKLQALTA